MKVIWDMIAEQLERMRAYERWKKHSECGNPRFKVNYVEVKCPCNQKHLKKNNDRLEIN